MKTATQRAAQIKRIFSEGVNGVTWINFTATDGAGVRYLSGHNAMGENRTLSSEGEIYIGVEYLTGSLILKGRYKQIGQVIPDRMIQLCDVKALDNSDLTKPAPSKAVREYVEKFEFNF